MAVISSISFLAMNIGISYYISTKLNSYAVSLLQGAPYFNDNKKLVNLEKTFFFLDDENGFKPSLFHHGLLS